MNPRAAGQRKSGSAIEREALCEPQGWERGTQQGETGISLGDNFQKWQLVLVAQIKPSYPQPGPANVCFAKVLISLNASQSHGLYPKLGHPKEGVTW